MCRRGARSTGDSVATFGVPLKRGSRLARARQKAGSGSQSLVAQPARRVVGVDGHPADRIDQQSFVVALALMDGLVEDDGLSDVAKRPPTALAKCDAVDRAGCISGRLAD